MIVNHVYPKSLSSELLSYIAQVRINALTSVRSNDGALYKALEVAVATSDFIAAPCRISLASFHSVGSSRTPEEVWIEGHVSVKWPILCITITATSRLDKLPKVPAGVRDPERVSSPVTLPARISLSIDMLRPRRKRGRQNYTTIVIYFAQSSIPSRLFNLFRFYMLRLMRRTRTNVAFQIGLCTLRLKRFANVEIVPQCFFNLFSSHLSCYLWQRKRIS